jgi:microcystin-dependent protein
VAYNDLVTDVASFTTQASAASSDLAGVVAGADVLATQFDSLKSTVDALSIALNELTGGQYTVLKDTAAARPATPSTGQLFFASDTKALSLYGGAWGVVSPTGIVSPFAGATAPEGWLLCDGTTTHSTTTYAALFALIAYTYGGSGGTFGVPNLKGRTVIGVGLGVDAIPVTGVLGVAQGAATVTLTGAESGTSAHSHTNSVSETSAGAQSSRGIVNNLSTAGSGSSSTMFWSSQTGGLAGDNNAFSTAGNHTHSVGVTINNSTAAAASSAHTNIQPSLPLNYIIKV